MSRLISACVIFAALAAPAAAAPSETAQERDRRMAWWREARFGMFIHWGAVRGARRRVEGQAHRDDRRVDHERPAQIPVAEYEQARARSSIP